MYEEPKHNKTSVCVLFHSSEKFVQSCNLSKLEIFSNMNKILKQLLFACHWGIWVGRTMEVKGRENYTPIEVMKLNSS